MTFYDFRLQELYYENGHKNKRKVNWRSLKVEGVTLDISKDQEGTSLKFFVK